MLKLNSRTTFEAMVQEALNGKDENKANNVRTKIIKALASDDLLHIDYTKDWITHEVYEANLKNGEDGAMIMKLLSDGIKNSDLTLTYKYVLYSETSNTDEYVEGDTYNELYLWGDAIYDFLGMYCDLLEKYNNTYNEGLEELGLVK